MSKRDKPAGVSNGGSARPEKAQRSDFKRSAGQPERAARELQASQIRAPGAENALSFAQLQVSTLIARTVPSAKQQSAC